jgi:hypothetical protein
MANVEALDRRHVQTARERFAETVKVARANHPKLVEGAQARGVPEFAIDLAVGIGAHWAEKPDNVIAKKAEDLRTKAAHPAVKDLVEREGEIDPSSPPSKTKEQVAQHLARFHVHETMQAMNGSGPAYEDRPDILDATGALASAVVAHTQQEIETEQRLMDIVTANGAPTESDISATLAALDEATIRARERELRPTETEAVLVYEMIPGEKHTESSIAPSVYGMPLTQSEVRLTDLVSGRQRGPIQRVERVPKVDPDSQ